MVLQFSLSASMRFDASHNLFICQWHRASQTADLKQSQFKCLRPFWCIRAYFVLLYFNLFNLTNINSNIFILCVSSISLIYHHSSDSSITHTWLWNEMRCIPVKVLKFHLIGYHELWTKVANKWIWKGSMKKISLAFRIFFSLLRFAYVSWKSLQFDYSTFCFFLKDQALVLQINHCNLNGTANS